MPEPTYDALFEVLLNEGKLILLMIEIYQTRPLEPSRLFLEFNMRVLGWMLHSAHLLKTKSTIQLISFSEYLSVLQHSHLCEGVLVLFNHIAFS